MAKAPAKKANKTVTIQQVASPQRLNHYQRQKAIALTADVAPGHTLERWQLMNILSKREESPSTSALEMRIARLRKKLAGSGVQIRTLRGLGYVLEPEG